LVRQAAILGLSLLLLLGAWLLVRRWTGALEQSLDAAGLVAAVLLLGLWAGTLRWAWYRSAKRGRIPPGWTHHLFGILTAAGVLTFGTALSLPGSPSGALTAFWCILLGAEAVGGIAFHVRRDRDGDAVQDTCQDAVSTPAADDAGTTENTVDFSGATLRAEHAAEEDADDDSGELLAADELQRMSRVRDPQGGEVVSGLVRCWFDPGERQRDVHLAFCPPLRKAPHFSLEQVEGPVARIRTSLVETFGVGLEVKLTALSSAPTSIQIQFFACEEPMDGEVY